jgi:FkbM family methyltransferase
MTKFYVLLYRMYLVLLNTGLVNVFRRWPRARHELDKLKRVVGQRHLWVRVQSGLSHGMWMKLFFPREVSYWRGTHEPEVQSFIAAAVRPGDVIYDVGAHVGTIALGAARLVGDLGRVVAFDGDPENVERLRENSSRNGLERRLLVVHAAVWSRTRRDGICFRRGNTFRSQGGVEADGNRPVLGNGEVIEVPVITLDDFVAAGGPLPQLVKIDVEGGEYEILCGGANLFAGQRPVIIAEVHHQRANEQIKAWLDEYKYDARWYTPKENFPRRLFASPREHSDSIWLLNLAPINSESQPSS